MRRWIAAVLACILCLALCACQPQDATPTTTQPSQPAVTEAADRDSALHQAQTYLSVMNYSYAGLIQQLMDIGYSQADATYAADNCAANWTQQAVDSANTHILSGSFSKGAMYGQLDNEGFTQEQIVAALEGCEANWNQEALQALQAYLEISPFSESSMYDQLMFEDFTEDEITYAMESCNVDWAAQALRRAQQLKEEGTAADILAQTLVLEGYTQEQADHAANNA